ncbi:hypothetical protein [Arthrobacter sp. StoSoilB5]|jgi:hypothetical protein|uniref:DUF6881 domain-containing protein n=1 Tax=Arthrobacter sp. StoSoilB5 TaxID=2830992 RepID=UPI001CC782B5|nr:hypothetical protein [Arthrobacter sp. StoSoilB5]BCW45479.1 hypothetical protein StoSoilB5_26630 [Arthrobacter sp. StoSoilB5]
MEWYQRVEWHHGFDEEPIVIYSEIDAKGFETRKVEQFRDGSTTFADELTATGSSWLSEVALPSLEEINEQSEFKAEPIAASTFEGVWRSAHEERG